MLSKEEIVQELKNQQFSPEDFNTTHEVILAIRDIVTNDSPSSYRAEIFGEAEELLQALIT